jgi:hypothetical protein
MLMQQLCNYHIEIFHNFYCKVILKTRGIPQKNILHFDLLFNDCLSSLMMIISIAKHESN